MSFEERLGVTRGSGMAIRQDRKLKKRIRNALFKDKAYIEDLDFTGSCLQAWLYGFVRSDAKTLQRT
nr:hypothetical protein [Desulfobacterales bacterium]